jgi:L-malate glycosyltransferase
MMNALGKLLEKYFLVQYASAKAGKWARLYDMVSTLFRARKTTSLVLIDTYSSLNFWYAWLLSRLCVYWKIPYIPILHGGNLPHRLQQGASFSALLWQQATALVAPSTYLQEAFAQKGYVVDVVPNFVDITRYPFQLRTNIQPKLLWVRAFHKTYAPEIAIQVLYQLQLTYPDAQLCMVGPEKDGSLRRCSIRAKELGIAENVLFTGALSKNAWLERSRHYDVMLNTTQIDNTPVSIMEAMALGLPVVSTNVGGMPYLLEQESTGMLTPAGDVSAMVQAIKTLINNPSLAQKISSHARKKALQWDAPQIENQWLLLFKKHGIEP